MRSLRRQGRVALSWRDVLARRLPGQPRERRASWGSPRPCACQRQYLPRSTLQTIGGSCRASAGLLDTHPPAHTGPSWQTQSTPKRTSSDDATAAKTTLRTESVGKCTRTRLTQIR